ncbi:uncharacterized protein LOC114256313 [Camellia sinensis]|uniref:uncharacterized protein LOC114256313 n=1 Tax=Camellia sinensis TaxID=4442 RepID=UPI0010356974|nr:uncharacterized protein LOC114256313 [Camellia sinensis]
MTDEIFKSRDELIRWARDVGRRSGFVIVVKKLDAGGTHRKKPRLTLASKKLDTNDDRTLIVICGVHNHPVVVCLERHSYAGRLSHEETSLLVDMSKSMLAVNKYIEWRRNYKDTETVTDLFFAHPVSLDLLRAFPCVLLMDCTYKTNRYRWPLLEIVGITSTEKTFSVGFAYLQYEKEDNYAWALGILRSLMDENSLPNVIVTDRELSLMNAIATIFPRATKALQYVESSWLDAYKERFVAAWIDTSLEMTLAESKRASFVGIDIVTCGCVVRRIHGLPCAHEIVDYIRENRPIPLTSVDPHWSKLDMLNTPKKSNSFLDCKSELDMFARHYKEVDPTMKVQMLKKLREIHTPERTFLTEPEVKLNLRGRPSLKIDTSTPRGPSAFEFVSSAQYSYLPSVGLKKNTCPKKLKSMQQPKVIWEGWMLQVKKDLLQELHAHIGHYKSLFGRHERVDELTTTLAYFESNAGYSHWLTIPDMGPLISSFYNVFLVHGHPMPPIATNWRHYHLPAAAG